MKPPWKMIACCRSYLLASCMSEMDGITGTSSPPPDATSVMPDALSSSAPVVAAEHDGVALHLSYTNSTGYLGVRRVVQAKGAVFVAEYKRTTIGRYEAAVDAAVAFANKLKEVEAADEAAAEEARAAARRAEAAEAEAEAAHAELAETGRLLAARDEELSELRGKLAARDAELSNAKGELAKEALKAEISTLRKELTQRQKKSVADLLSHAQVVLCGHARPLPFARVPVHARACPPVAWRARVASLQKLRRYRACV